jgi:hypothetical protein
MSQHVKQEIAVLLQLRASVLRLWMDDCEPGAPYMDDVNRFNETIDQAP